MTRNRKTPQSNTTSKKASKTACAPDGTFNNGEEYLDLRTLDRKWMREEEANAFVQQMYNDIKNDPEIYTITQYLNNKGIYYKTYWRWKERFPLLPIINEAILSVLADRREAHVAKDFRAIQFVMPHYDPHIWGKMFKYHSDLKKAEQSETQKVGVVLPCYNSCCVKVKEE